MRPTFIIISILLFLSNVALGQLQINWQQSYGGSDNEDAQDIIQNNDGYLILGSTPSNDGNVSYNHGNGDYWIVQVDELGNLLWEKTFGGSSGEYLYDGFYAYNSSDIYLVGTSMSTDGDISFDPYSGANNVWVVKIDNEYNIIWDRKVGSPVGLPYDKFGTPTNDGGVIISAQVVQSGGDISTFYGGYDGWLIKLDSNGNTEWDFSIGTSEFDYVYNVTQTSEGGYIASASGGASNPEGNIDCITHSGSSDGIVYKLDPDGNGEWHHCYGGSENDGIFEILEVEDGYLLVGHGRSNDGDLEGSGWHGDNDIWLIKIDFGGAIIWQKCYGGSNSDSPRTVFQTIEGDFIVFSNTHSFDGDVVDNPSNSKYNSSIWVFKINSSGELLWQQCIGGEAKEEVKGVTKFNDNEYAVAGGMSFSPSGDVNCSYYTIGSKTNYWAFMLNDITVGTSEVREYDEVQIYPNPANSLINIKLPENFIFEKTAIELFDLYGKSILSLYAPSHSFQINIKNQASGLYLLKIQTESNLLIKRVVVL